MKIIKVDSYNIEKEKIKKIVKILKKGGIIIFPTDTVYGIGTDAENEESVNRLYQIKNRPRIKPLILFIEKKEEVLKFAQKIPLSAQKLINDFWPGPLTLIFRASSSVPKSIISKEGKVGIRFPESKISCEIVKESRVLLATTSANVSGEVPPLKIEEINKDLKEKVDLIIDGGGTLLGEESTIVDVTFSPPRLIREGWLLKKRINKTLKEERNILFVCTGNTCRSPMAEGFFKKMWPKGKDKVNVSSAGTSTLIGLRPTELAIKVMREKNIDISSYRSTPLNKDLVEKADLILTMSNFHKKIVSEISSLKEGKIFLFKEFTSGDKEEIPDPAGESLETYRKCAREIEKEVKTLIKKIT